MKIYVMVDFGSTFTKVTAIDVKGEQLIGTAQSATTINTDVNIGLNIALEELYKNCNLSPNEILGKFACSSAAGGLKMAAVGLVPDLTLKAAKMAALGAGAKVVCSYGYELDEMDVADIEEKECDIVMLCGGTDGGNKSVILYNAQMIADSGISCPILVCGNRSVATKVKNILQSGGKLVYTCSNVLPTIETVDVAPAQAQIREIFIEHIIHAKGLDKAQTLFKKSIIPTPAASLRAAQLIADGTSEEPGIGSLLVVEVGGATTNIHSIADNLPASSLTILRGLPEPRVSRTVEGDMGIRYNAGTIYDFEGSEALINAALSTDPSLSRDDINPDAYTDMLSGNVNHIPENSAEIAMDNALAMASISTAVARHAGCLKSEFTINGEVMLQYGKNLTDVQNLLGTGGIFKYGGHPDLLLSAALFDENNPQVLKPKSPKTFIDTKYLLYAVGLLSQEFPTQALRVAKKYLKEI